MNKTTIITSLRTNNYSFEDNGDQIIIKLARGYFLKLYIENDIVVKNEDMVKQFGLLNGKSLKLIFKIGIIGYLIYILFFVLYCILDSQFFSSGGKYFIIVLVPIMLFQLLEFLSYNSRLSKIKKLLNLND